MSSFDPPLSRTTAVVLAVSAIAVSTWLFALWMHAPSEVVSAATKEVLR